LNRLLTVAAVLILVGSSVVFGDEIATVFEVPVGIYVHTTNPPCAKEPEFWKIAEDPGALAALARSAGPKAAVTIIASRANDVLLDSGGDLAKWYNAGSGQDYASWRSALHCYLARSKRSSCCRIAMGACARECRTLHRRPTRSVSVGTAPVGEIMLAIAVAALAATAVLPVCEHVPSIERDRPLAENVRVTLVTDRSTYHVGEPLQLVATLENVGNRVAHVYASSVGLCVTDIQYRRVGERSKTYAFPYEKSPSLRRLVDIEPAKLQPGKAITYSSLVAVDGATGQFVFSRPGTYEVTWSYNDSRPGIGREASTAAFVEDENGTLRADLSPSVAATARDRRLVSNVVTVTVFPPARGEEEAAAAYLRNGIGLIAQSHVSPYRYPISERDLELAAALTERYPNSTYAKHVRRGLREELKNRLARRDVPRETLEKHQRLLQKVQSESVDY
jgi:hypothetical protein